MANQTINVGVLLNDDPHFREALASDHTLDKVIEPKDVNQMLRYFRKLAKEGKQIKRLILFGHGNDQNEGQGHHIGILQPGDVDLAKIKSDREFRYGIKLELEGKLKKAREALAAASDSAQKEKLQAELATLDERHKGISENYEDHTFKEKSYEEIENLMAQNAVVGLLNCNAASDQAGLDFMKNLGKALLAKNGGKVIGCDKLIKVKKIGRVLSYITGKDQHLIQPMGKWVEVTTPATHQTRSRCGAPCKDFQRYGFCDNPASADGGPCHLH